MHNIVVHMAEVDDKAIQVAEQNIEKYMAYFRQFLSLVFPKLHFLEDHIVPWMKRWGFGLALHGEQVERLSVEK